MKLSQPFLISARLAPALQIGQAWLSLDGIQVGAARDGRDIAEFILDLPDGREYRDSALKSGVQGFRGPVEVFAAFLSFLSHAAETTDEPERLFPPHVLEWARDNRNAIDCAHADITDERGDARAELIEEE